MKKILSVIKINKDLLIVFVLSVIASANYFVDICSGYLNYGRLDSEFFFLADYGFLKHLIPNKDFLYPYGIIQYYRFENVITLFFYYLIVSLLFTIIYFLFKKVIKEKIFLYTSMLFLFIFVFKFIGFGIFGRYGVFVILSMLFSYLLYNSKELSKHLLLSIGIVLALVFFLINDQGVYLILSFVILYFLNDVIKYKRKVLISIKYYKSTFNNFVFLIIGFLIGLLPLIAYLIYNNASMAFLHYFNDLGNIVVASKTPFLNFITSPENLFTMATLSFALFYLTVRYIYFKNKFNLLSFYQLSLALSILFMEQKSIIRSISTQITFVAFILLIVLSYDLLSIIKQNNYKKFIIFSIVLFSVVFLIGLREDYSPNLNINQTVNNIQMSIDGSCYKNNVNAFLTKNQAYTQIANKVKSQPNFNGKVFIFPPGDSIFYSLFNQKPPFYNSFDSGASLKAQNQAINYIQKNNIQYLIFNFTDTDNIVEGVPSYIRQSTEFKYILGKFYPLERIADHLILIKKDNSDFLKSPILGEITPYRDSLLNIYLYMIPYSEGLYKYQKVEKANLLINANNQSSLEKQLKLKHISSKNKVVVLIPSVSSKNGTQSSLKITADGIQSNIYFNSCKIGKSCVINLSNIPLFYKNRNIEKIQLDKNFRGEIRVIDLNNFGNLW